MNRGFFINQALVKNRGFLFGEKERQMDGEKLTYSVKEASRLLGVSSNHLYEMARQKQIPVLKLGKRLLIPRKALNEFLESAGIGNDRV